jgi:eukaryotic-like serine/threonine-protein kinase
MPEPPVGMGTSVTSRSGIRYRILQFLGSGGNSFVYLALSMNGYAQGVLFALKIFTRFSNAERLRRFEQEAEFLRNCTHPSVMKIYDNGTIQRDEEGKSTVYPFVVVEYLPECLHDVFRGEMTTAERVSYTLQLLSSLAYLNHHNPAVVHRDIKPKNIFIKGRSCVLGDFGLMKFVNDNTGQDREAYIESIEHGMPYRYPTPDLVSYALGKSELTTKSDVFQLGIVVAEMFTGINICHQAARLAPITLELGVLSRIPGAFGIQIGSLIQRMLEMDSDGRPSAANLIDPWEGIFREVVDRSHDLNGRIF